MDIARQLRQAGATLCAIVALHAVSPRPADAFSMVMGSIDEGLAGQWIESCTFTAYHTVRPNDSFARIAQHYYGVEAVDVKRYGGSVDHVYLPQWIADANGLELTDTIQPGQVLRVPYVIKNHCRRR